MFLDELVSEQQTFYDRRANEWPRWIEAYMGPLTDALRAELASIDELVGAHVLELAAGTGFLTDLLSPIAAHVTALDASPTMLAHLERRQLPNVTTLCHDVFDWSPSRRYDAIVCANWLSHVPHGLWRGHWTMLSDALQHGGVVVVIDGTVEEIPHLGGHSWWQARMSEDGHREPVTTRKLDSGHEFVVVKHFWEPEDLLSQLAELGWRGDHVRLSKDRGMILYRLCRA